MTISIWTIDGELLQSISGSNGNESVLHNSQSFRTGASPSGGLVLYPELNWKEGVFPLYRNAVGVFYKPSRQGLHIFTRVD